MKLIVTDANIFIDLFDLDLIQFLFECDFEIHTTKNVIEELEDDHIYILKNYENQGMLEVYILTELEWQDLRNKDYSKQLSTTDMSILFYVEFLKPNANILSGDGMIRKICKKKAIEVHGTLWLFESFLEKGKIDYSTAISKMKLLIEVNTWTPRTLCLALIEKWEKILKTGKK